MEIDLKKYAGNTLPKYRKGKSYDTKEDFEDIQRMNKKVDEISHEYSTKEKLSYLSAKNLVLTD